MFSEKSLEPFSRKIEKNSFLGTFGQFGAKLDFFSKIGLCDFLPISFYTFMQKIRKILRANPEIIFFRQTDRQTNKLTTNSTGVEN